jgi:arabinosaccharide transport system permease protein
MPKENIKSGRKPNMILRIIMVAFFSLIGIILVLPFICNFVSTFKPGNELIRHGLNLTISSENFTLANWKYLFGGTTSYFTWFSNSMILTVLQVVFTLGVSAFVGYGFAMYDFKGKNAIFICVLLIMMVPFEILMLPMYMQIINMKLVNSFAGIILPFVANASSIFFFRQYLLGIPKSIIDAGRVDGASEYGIFFKLIFPVMKPSFAAMGILNTMGAWNNFLWPMLVLRDESKFTLPIGLNTLLTPYGNNYDLLIVGSFFSILPIFILFLFFQRYFIEGMTAGAVKG